MNYCLGFDIGSTTAKAALIDKKSGKLIFSKYVRHNTDISGTLHKIVEEINTAHEGVSYSVAFTGSAGMGVSEQCGFEFTQEVVAAAEVVLNYHKDVRTLIDIGGEDAKVVFFNEEMQPDIRMNGNCAGGTGAFIDQMAKLLNIPVEEISNSAESSTAIYPIASRCGVFAKTDIQNLISRDIPKEDIAASIYRAVTYQVLNTLIRGTDIKPKIMFAGGPFTFQPELARNFIDVLELSEDDIVVPEKPEMLPAMGAALYAGDHDNFLSYKEIIQKLKKLGASNQDLSKRLPALFSSKEEWQTWETEKAKSVIPAKEFSEEDDIFLGIDSGSTTTKIVVCNREGALLKTYYGPNNGNPIAAVAKGLKKTGITKQPVRSAVTGYGEDLIKQAFNLDDGLVETMAHYRAASFFEPNLSFLLDIGGQDMKAIFVEDGVINNLELNEACSSGCGSFIETFAHSLNMNIQDFSNEAATSESPCDLGTRCTVFMNSKVKQSLKEGANVADISAGLAYSVVKNCLTKVLKMTDYSLMGDSIVVQGGTFKNPAILRAFELISGKSVVRPDRAELMGAWGSALSAIDRSESESTKESSFIGFENLSKAENYKRKSLRCKGCENFCIVNKLSFDGQGDFYTGNKCEKIFSNRGEDRVKGKNLHEIKRDLLFNRNLKPEGDTIARIGIPRALNMWDDFPFWATLFRETGFEVVISDPSSMQLAEKGYGTVASENICFPAKLTNGHIFNLAEKKVDRIFYPMARYAYQQFPESLNCYNCPVVTGYPEVIGSTIEPEKRFEIPFDKPEITMADKSLLKKFIKKYLSGFNINRSKIDTAFELAWKEHDVWRSELADISKKIVEENERGKKRMILLLGRPYHADALISHKMGELISEMGLDVITEDALPDTDRSELEDVDVLTQWSYPNRIYDTAMWGAEHELIEVVQTNSFGCGPDAIAVDETNAILNQYGKNLTAVRIDEITSPGSVRLRIRSMMESLMAKDLNKKLKKIERQKIEAFEVEHKDRTILAPIFSEFYTEFLIASFRNRGYNLEVLPMADKESIEIGLKYANNDICYPATIVIGDLIKALQSGKYDRNEVAVGLTQTGGQCRASSYVALLKKAMFNAGFSDVPIVAISTHPASSKMHLQPGFQIPKTFQVEALMGIIFGDVLSRLYYSHAVREKNRGESSMLVKKYIDLAEKDVSLIKSGKLFKLLDSAVEEFNSMEVDNKEYPKVGIVGEIFVKFNPFSNHYICDTLLKEGIEPVVPPLVSFFLTSFVTIPFNSKENFVDKGKSALAYKGIELIKKISDHYISKANKAISKAKVETIGIHDVEHLAKDASSVLSLINQYGESWLLAGDIVSFLNDGVKEVVCLQPFGCIANHIIAKGVEKRMKDLYPQLNLLFLDIDAGSSEVNLLNRLEFLMRSAKQRTK